MWSILGGNFDITKYLLDRKAKVDSRGESRLTPLHYAAGTGDEEIVLLLIQKGADVQSKDGSGSTPLDTAAYYNQPGMCQILLSHGAGDAESLQRAFHFAEKQNHQEVMDIISDAMSAGYEDDESSGDSVESLDIVA
jgi:cytohesin